MISLPNLEPRDSYALWYTSSGTNYTPFVEATNNTNDQPTHGQNAGPHHRRHNPLLRTPLARLRLDEEYVERRKQNIQNYGNSWIKPPGIPKSLYQLREEKREQEEHQEALRREALAQELAEAEAEGVEDLLHGEGTDPEMEQVRDLDDEIPEADSTGLDANDPESEDEENDVEDVPRGMLASRVSDDVYREAIIRGEDVRARFGNDGGSTIDEEDPSNMLQEEDLVHEGRGHQELDMDMDADLDADIPEAETGGYEHTDTEAELTSSDEDESIDDRRLPRGVYNPAASMVRSDGTQNSMDLSGIMSSSQIGSSPRTRTGLRGRNRRS